MQMVGWGCPSLQCHVSDWRPLQVSMTFKMCECMAAQFASFLAALPMVVCLLKSSSFSVMFASHLTSITPPLSMLCPGLPFSV